MKNRELNQQNTNTEKEENSKRGCQKIQQRRNQSETANPVTRDF